MTFTGGGYIRKIDIESYDTEFNRSCFQLWNDWKSFGAFPFSGGYAEQPDHIVKVMRAMMQASDLYSEYKRTTYGNANRKA